MAPKPAFKAIIEAGKRVYLSYASEDAFVAEVTSSDGDRQYEVTGVITTDGDLHLKCDLACGWWANRRTWCKHIYGSLSKYHEWRKEQGL